MGLKYTILGGDKRSLELGKFLLKDKKDVCIYGFDKISQENQCMNLYEALDADFIIGPLPFSRDNVTVDADFSSETIEIQKVLNLLTEKQIILGGKISQEIQKKLKEKNVKFFDYFEREEMQVLNAVPTAEGAIQVAMEEMPITLHGSNAMVLGYGRIGKVLSDILCGIKANVYVEARKHSDLAWIKNKGFVPVKLKDLKTYLPKMDVVFNTIPEMILNEDLLKAISTNCIIIDLASKPGGVDFKGAEDMGIKAISALGLPGKVAPVTAAEVIKDTIYNIIEDWEV